MHPWASDIDTHVHDSAAISKLADLVFEENEGPDETLISDSYLVNAMGEQCIARCMWSFLMFYTPITATAMVPICGLCVLF